MHDTELKQDFLGRFRKIRSFPSLASSNLYREASRLLNIAPDKVNMKGKNPSNVGKTTSRSPGTVVAMVSLEVSVIVEVGAAATGTSGDSSDCTCTLSIIVSSILIGF